MAPSRSDKSQLAAGLGLVTSALLSHQNPQHTTAMAFGNLFGRSSNPSSPTSPRPNGSSRPPLGPGSSKLDYAYGLNPSDPQWPSQSYNHGGDDAPPAYRPQGGSEFDDWATGSKKPEKNPASHNTRTSAARIPAPDRIHIPTGSKEEDPLLALKNYDIVIILDDSFSMTIADNVYKRSRWDQVSSDSVPPHMHALSS